MRQRRWLELIKDYDLEIHYHPGKANVVADALSRVLWFKGRLVVPRDMGLRKKILDEAHTSMFTIHPGSNKMYQDLKQKFWWTRMKREIAKYVSECDVCQRVKADHLKPAGMLQPLAVPSWKWEDIHMDFIVGLPRTQKGYDSIWVIIDRLTKSAHFIPGLSVCIPLLGAPTDRSWHHFDSQFRIPSANQWPSRESKSNPRRHVESFYQKSLEMAPFEPLYGRRCRTPLNWSEPGEQVIFGPDLVTQAEEQVKFIQSNLKRAQSRQKSYSDKRRRPLVFEVDDHVYLQVSPMKGVHRFGVKGKLAPRYVGPFKITEQCGPVAYRLELPPHLAAVHDIFHVSQLKKCWRVPEEAVDTSQIQIEPDLTYEERPIKILDQKQRATRRRAINFYKVQWNPLDADDWLRIIESKFSLLPQLTEQQKARFAAQCLHGPSGAWCASFLAMQPAGHQVTWDEFHAAFRAHYLPPSLIELKQREFRALQQGDMSVLEYVQAFIRLSQYSPEDVDTDPCRAARLLGGFDPTLRLTWGTATTASPSW
ncbi:hypothetical protein U9M48_024188 [Paspalum notatum var. saurae]|uniref:Retrotransposon protein, putative, Ty3-gypsy subclass n=1 Tax=Paspalum notatum var. saurae TaxID=547442 RepID=A0AAQ3WVE1_PASNO